ncbi:MAG: hypothetical protein AABY07_11255 [Nanoarchaeota archaeon]
MNHKNIHYFTVLIFGLIALLHLIRIIYSIPARFGNWDAPMWVSWVAILIAGYLAILLWRNAKR